MKETDLTNYQKSLLFPKYRVNLKKGTVINDKDMLLGSVNEVTGYQHITIHGKIPFYIHRLIWIEANPTEIIEENEQIDHKDNNRSNNKIENLQKLTISENIKKTHKERDYSYLKNIRNNKRYIKAICAESGKFKLYAGLNQVKKRLDINAGSVKHQCEKGNTNLKSPITQKTYKFEYITKEEYEEMKEKGVKCYEKIKMTEEELKEKKEGIYRERFKEKKKEKQKENEEEKLQKMKVKEEERYQKRKEKEKIRDEEKQRKKKEKEEAKLKKKQEKEEVKQKKKKEKSKNSENKNI